MIYQKELESFVLAAEKIKQAQNKIKLAEAKQGDYEKALIERLSSGEDVEDGEFIAYVKVEQGRASVKWKEVVESLKGAAFVEKVLQTAPRPAKDVLIVEVKTG